MNLRIFTLLTLLILHPSHGFCSEKSVEETMAAKRQGWTVKRVLLYAGGAVALLLGAVVAAPFAAYKMGTEKRKLYQGLTIDQMKELAYKFADLLPTSEEKNKIIRNIEENSKSDPKMEQHMEQYFGKEVSENLKRDVLISTIGWETMLVRQQEHGKMNAKIILHDYGLTTDEFGRIEKLELPAK